MPQATLTATQYNGSLLGAQFLSSQRTIVLNKFGTPAAGTLVDNNGVLSTADNGTALWNGQPLTYIGSGHVQPGVSVLGVTVPLGETKPVVMFQAAGHIFFHYPEGPPNIVGAVALVVTVSSAGYPVFSPICFTAGTRIRTPDGDRLIETLVAGDAVTDADGAAHDIVWIGRRSLTLPVGLSVAFRKWLPVRIPKSAFAPGVPDADLLVSQQHRVMIEGARSELMFGSHRVLVPAKALLGDVVTLEGDVRHVTYFHILCDEHVILLANGLAAESLFCGPVTRNVAAEAARSEAEAVFPELADRLPGGPMTAAYPMIRAVDAAVLAPWGQV